MSYEPKHIHLWTLPECYVGEVWPGWYSSGCGQSRDSDALERSNFAVMLKALGGETDTVKVIRESHWAVGWVEWIGIHQDDEKSLRIADELQARLVDYSILDENHFSEVEHEDACLTWKNCYSPLERVAYIRDHRSQFEFADFRDLLGCVRGEYFAGYDNELIAR